MLELRDNTPSLSLFPRAMTLAYTVSGLLVGLLVGLTGVGGGSLMTPLLTLMFGFSPATAVGTDLASASLTKGVGTIAHRSHGHIRWDIVKRLCLGSLPAALVTVIVLKSAGNLDAEWMRLIRLTIGVSVILTVISLLFRQRVLGWLAANPRYRLQGDRKSTRLNSSHTRRSSDLAPHSPDDRRVGHPDGDLAAVPPARTGLAGR